MQKSSIIILCVFFMGCTKSTRPPSIIDPKNYDDISDYVFTSKKHAMSFLDQYYDQLKIHKLKRLRTRKKYEKSFFEIKGQLSSFQQIMLNSVIEYNSVFKNFFQGKLFDFFYVNKGSSKTLFLVRDPSSSANNYFNLEKDLEKSYPGMNIVGVDATRVLRNEQEFSSDEVNKFFIKDVQTFLEKSNFDKTTKIFNIICFAYYTTFDFLENHHELYDKAILYTPYSRLDLGNELFPYAELFANKKYLDQAQINYTWYLPRGKNMQSWVTPKIFNKINVRTILNLSEPGYTGRTLKKVKNRYLIYTGNEYPLLPRNFDLDSFSKNRIQFLKKHDHNVIFNNERSKYIAALDKFIHDDE